jgi:hypothetical protein
LERFVSVCLFVYYASLLVLREAHTPVVVVLLLREGQSRGAEAVQAPNRLIVSRNNA